MQAALPSRFILSCVRLYFHPDRKTNYQDAPKRKRRSTRQDEGSPNSEPLTVCRERKRGNRAPAPVQAPLLAWLDHCLDNGLVFKDTAPDYLKHAVTQILKWGQIDQKLRAIVKTHNGRSPYTPLILEKGTGCLENFSGTQLQNQVTKIKSSLRYCVPEPLVGISSRRQIQIVLTSTSTNSTKDSETSNTQIQPAAAPDATSSRVVCLDSEFPPSSPGSPPPHQRLPPNDVNESRTPGGLQPYIGDFFEPRVDDPSNGTLAQKVFTTRDIVTAGEVASAAAWAVQRGLYRGLQFDQRADDDDGASPGSFSTLSDVTSAQSMVTPQMMSARPSLTATEHSRSLIDINDAATNNETRSEHHCDCGNEANELRRSVSQLEKKVVDIERAQLINHRIAQGTLQPSDYDAQLGFHRLLTDIDQVCLALASGEESPPLLPSVWDRQSPLTPLTQRAAAANHQSWVVLTCTQPPERVEALRCLIAASVMLDVFEHGDLGSLGDTCFLLNKYREAVLLKDGAEALRKLDQLAHERMRDDPLLQSQLEIRSKSLAGKLEETLSSICPPQTQEADDDAPSPTQTMFQKVFASALSLKTLLLQTGQKYRADFVPAGAHFSPDTMVLVGLESMELWQQSRRSGSREPGLPATSPRAVRFCVFPAIFAYPMETEWASKDDVSAFTVDYCNFVRATVPEENLSLVSKAVVSVFE
ncbi:hypothetical protein PG990_010969 [Apiospora arundinis]